MMIRRIRQQQSQTAELNLKIELKLKAADPAFKTAKSWYNWLPNNIQNIHIYMYILDSRMHVLYQALDGTMHVLYHPEIATSLFSSLWAQGNEQPTLYNYFVRKFKIQCTMTKYYQI